MIASDVNKGADKPNLTSRPEWRIARVPEAKTPSDLTVTHVNQTYDLLVCIWHLMYLTSGMYLTEDKVVQLHMHGWLNII